MRTMKHEICKTMIFQILRHFQCPTCHNESIYATKNKRCMHCGQVLDWKSYEEGDK